MIYLLITLLFLILLSGVSFSYSYLIGTSLKMIGMLPLLPELMMAVTCIITIITTIYKVKGTLFGFKDYDITMSLPVKTDTVVASRLMLLYAINLIFVLIVMLPADIVYGILANASPAFYILSLLSLFFIPLVPMVVAAVIGTVIAAAAARFKHSNLVNIVILFATLIGIMAFSFKIQDSQEMLGEMSTVLTKQVDGLYPLAGMYKAAVCEYDLLSFLIFIMVSVLAFALFSKLVGILFKSLNSYMSASRAKSNYRLGQLEQTSPFKALFRKELKRYFNSPLYVMNTAVGIVMMTIGAIATIFLKPETIARLLEIPQAGSYIGTYAPIAIAMCVALTDITASSVSLEGKNLWILKSSPVSMKTIFNSKIAVNLLMTLPAIFLDGIIITLGLKLELTELVILWVMPGVYAFFISISGLLINLKLPNLNWTTEITVIKQSAAVLVVMLVGLIAAAIPVLLIIALSLNAVVVNAITSAVLAVVSFLLYHYLNTRGAKLFSSL